MDPLIVVITAACWIALGAVWVAAAVHGRAAAVTTGRPNGSARHRARRPARPGPLILIALIVVAAGSLVSSLADPRLLTGIAIESSWLQPAGVVVLVASTAFAIWARVSLGTSWSPGPGVVGDGRLRTGGPYGVTRHPIYTGVLGMVIGTALVSSQALSILVVLASLLGVEVKIHREEAQLLASFPDEYAGYRRRVPQLVPGLALLRR